MKNINLYYLKNLINIKPNSFLKELKTSYKLYVIFLQKYVREYKSVFTLKLHLTRVIHKSGCNLSNFRKSTLPLNKLKSFLARQYNKT